MQFFLDGERRFAPIIEIADNKHKRLSFINLIEAHVLSAIRLAVVSPAGQT
ncbi:MAG: hypothetical protein ACM3NI_06125 [Bacteroidota bacterium]